MADSRYTDDGKIRMRVGSETATVVSNLPGIDDSFEHTDANESSCSWFVTIPETSDRTLEPGDLVAFDTDLIGPLGFFTDVSRTWLVGKGKPSDEQRRLYTLAREQLEHNAELLKPGLGLLEMTEKAWKMPDAYVPNRYAEIVHGAGMAVEYPLVFYPEDVDASGYDGVFEENMVICVESYIGAVGGREGVKLEQPVVITRVGSQPLCTYPFEEHVH